MKISSIKHIILKLYKCLDLHLNIYIPCYPNYTIYIFGIFELQNTYNEGKSVHKTLSK